MHWAFHYIEKLNSGETVSFRPKGNSMIPRIHSGNLVTVEPVKDIKNLNVDDVVLCCVKGNYYLHLIKAIKENEFLIGNNKGHLNGWTGFQKIYGKCIKIEK